MDWRTRISENSRTGEELRYLFDERWRRRLRGQVWALIGADPGDIDLREEFATMLCRLLPTDVADEFMGEVIIWLRKRLVTTMSWTGKLVYSGMREAPRLLELYHRIHRWLDTGDRNIHLLDYNGLRGAISRGWRRAGAAEAKARAKGRWVALQAAARRETEYVKGGPAGPPGWIGGEDRTGEWIDEAEWDIVVPLSSEAAKYWGNGTFWCTSLSGMEKNYFEKYHNPDAGFVLFVFMNRRTGGIYQFEYGSRQFKDYTNNTCIDPVLVQGLHSMLRKHLRHERYAAKRIRSVGEWTWSSAKRIVLDERGLLHSDLGGLIVPAVVTARGAKCWYNRGLLHSWNDTPSYMQEDGSRFWHRHGVLHREGGPAIIWSDGSTEYWLDGIRTG
jgi:hypothetical protein